MNLFLGIILTSFHVLKFDAHMMARILQLPYRDRVLAICIWRNRRLHSCLLGMPIRLYRFSTDYVLVYMMHLLKETSIQIYVYIFWFVKHHAAALMLTTPKEL